MDALSELLALHPVDSALDLRCEFDAPWQADNAMRPPGAAPYHVILVGEAALEITGHAPVLLHAGDMLMLPRGHAHRLHVGEPSAANAPVRLDAGASDLTLMRNQGDGPRTELLCGEFRFAPVKVGSLLRSLPDVLIVRHADTGDWAGLRALVGMLREESTASRLGAASVLRHLASALFALMLRAWIAQAAQSPGLLTLMAHPRLGEAFRQMLAAPGHNWTIDTLAACARMSRASFVRAFRTVAGNTPAEVLLTVRMASAARDLDGGHRAMGDVAEAAGYGSEAAFNRAFQRYWGVTPGAYRRQRRVTT